MSHRKNCQVVKDDFSRTAGGAPARTQVGKPTTAAQARKDAIAAQQQEPNGSPVLYGVAKTRKGGAR